ncbi:MAG TPA: FeoA family protein [Longimicrobiales bacterium]|nr:FeoA family protein [Longimicrobiales bacterium]
MPDLSLTRRLLERLRAREPEPWRESCPAGPPVPEERCSGLDCDSVPLTSLAPGRFGTVSCLQEPGGARATRLAAMGVLPGVRIGLVQRWPSFVFRLGWSEFAVDEAMADHIRVHPE